MANLIIKPTSGGSLILQDEGGTAANTIDASGNTQLAGTLGVTGNATLSGTGNTLGTASGILTLNDGSVLNHAARADSWQAFHPSATVYSNAVIDFSSQNHVGSGITESAGRYTVSRAGLYWISCSLSNNGTSTTTIDCYLRVDGAVQSNTRIYQNRNKNVIIK